jgi:hypothetical protein
MDDDLWYDIPIFRDIFDFKSSIEQREAAPTESDFPSQEAASSGCGKKALTDEGNCTVLATGQPPGVHTSSPERDTSLPKGIALSDSS